MALIKALANSGTDTNEAGYKGVPTLPEGNTVGIIEKVETDDKEKFFFVYLKVTEAKAANVPANLLRPAFDKSPAETSSPIPAEVGKSYRKSVEITAKVKNATLPGEIAQNYKYKQMTDFLCGLFGVGVGQDFDVSSLADRAIGEKQELRGRTLVVNSNRFSTKGGRSKTNWSWEVIDETPEEIKANLKILG